MNKYIVTIDKSNEDIPTLIVCRESWSATGLNMDIVKVITGSEAIRIWNELSNKSDKEE